MQRFLEIGPESNRKTGRRQRFSDEWMTIGLSRKTRLDVRYDVNNGLGIIDDGNFEGVFASHVLEHITDPVAFLRECHRVLCPGGWCRMNVPNANWLIDRYRSGGCGIDHMLEQMRSYTPHLHRWAFDEVKLRKVFESAGFSGVTIVGPGDTGIEALVGHAYFWNRPDRSLYCEGFKDA